MELLAAVPNYDRLTKEFLMRRRVADWVEGVTNIPAVTRIANLSLEMLPLVAEQ